MLAYSRAVPYAVHRAALLLLKITNPLPLNVTDAIKDLPSRFFAATPVLKQLNASNRLTFTAGSLADAILLATKQLMGTLGVPL